MGIRIINLAELAEVPASSDVVPIQDVSSGETKKVAFSNLVPVGTTAARGTMSAADKTKLDGIEAGADVTDFGNVSTALAAATGNVSVNGNKLTNVDGPTAGTDAANQTYVDDAVAAVSSALAALAAQVPKPPCRVEAGSVTIDADDLGGVIVLTGAGAQALALGDLSGGMLAGRAGLLTIQSTGAATAPTITLSGGATIDGSASPFAMDVGRARLSLISEDGLAWYSGAP
jgi:hypothetical protein